MESFGQQQEQFTKSLQSLLTQWDGISQTGRSTCVEIQRLRNENYSLRLELQSLTAKPGPEGSDDNDENFTSLRQGTELRNVHPKRGSDQFQLLIQDNHTKQAQIDTLQSQLRKERARIQEWRQRHPMFSSPVVRSSPLPASKSNGISDRPTNSSKEEVPEFWVPATQFNATVDRLSNLPSDDSRCNSFTAKSTSSTLQETSGNQLRKRRRTDGRGAEAIPATTADGNDHNCKASSTKAVTDGTENEYTKSAVNKRSVSLLAKTTPQRITLQCPKFKPRTTIPAETDSPSFKKPKFLPASKFRPAASARDQTVRSRPIDRLSLGHFEPSLATHNGLGHAYQEVIRRQDQRKCLLGCTRPSCCGDQLRALVRALPTNSVDPTSSGWAADNQILLKFIGPGSEERIRTMTSVARRNLLEEAKIKILADKYGKMHRQLHDRAESPPGFWGTDMLASQEQRN